MIDAKIDQEFFTLLDDLMTKNKDASEGYRKAADHTADLDMKATFISYAKRRADFVEETKNKTKELGGDFSTGSSLTSTAHRIWMNMISTFTGKDSVFILKECLRGEQASLEEYKEAAGNETLPKSTKKMISRHKNFIQGALINLENKIAQLETVQS
jgi:uncharacterized protein (TIGR02284 family)